MTARTNDPAGPNEDRNRDKYRDGDDVRDPTPAEDRVDTESDSKSEARGPARENVGRTARGTASNPTGPEGNDKTRNRDDQ
jgi:hypothetical protein